MQMFLLSFPLWLLFLVFVIGSGLLAVGLSRLLARSRLLPEGDQTLALAIFQTVGAVFGIILAFTISAVYDEFQAASSTVSSESNDIGILYRLAARLPSPLQAELHEGVQRYVEQVVEQEWPQMAHGLASVEAAQALDQLWRLQHRIEATNAHALVAERLFRKLTDLADRRRDRLLDSRSRLAPLMWLLLFCGGGITVVFGAGIQSPQPRSQALMVGAMAALIGFGLLLVMALDCPFSGDMRVPPDALRDTAEQFRHWQG